jgi:hypothetical protein
MSFKEKFNQKNYLPVIIFFLALLFNQFSGNRGIFPIDSFSHFDIGYRVLNGDLPFRDYWVVSGPLIDLLQSFLFSIFDINWQIYLLNASILNGVIAVLMYKLFLNFKLNKIFSFLYAICFAILAYPVSGTPFVDFHSTYFSIISIYLLIFAIKTEKLVYWFFLPIFLGAAFLSKQVPASYIGFSIILLIAYDSIFNNSVKNFKNFLTLIISTSIFFLLFFSLLYFNEISFQSFLDQYINYPREIGKSRYLALNYDFKNVVLNFKFIHIIFLLLLILNISKFFSNKKFYKKINFKVFLILLLLFLSLIQHQILTRNAIFIFFLIPLFCAFAHIELYNLNYKYKNYLIYFLVAVCLITTFKYHVRFNLEKKFHELVNVNFTNSVDGKMLDEKFKGLKWITPGTKEKKEAVEEIKLLQEILEILKEDKQKKMLFTNYSFFSVLSGESMNSITRWFPGDDSAFPIKGSKFYNIYRNFLLKQIKSKEITNIYVISDVNEKNLLDYLPLECLKKSKIHKHVSLFKINNKCQDLYRN